MIRQLLVSSLFLAFTSVPASAGNVRLEAWGTIATAQGTTGSYAGVAGGQSAHLSFEVTTPGTDVNPGHWTNFAIVSSSLQFTLGPVVVGVSGGAPQATLRNADPVADGVLASALLTDGKNMDFSFSDCSGAMFTSTDPEQNLGSWSGAFYCVYGWTIFGGGTYIEIDLDSFAISLPFTGTAMCFGDGTQALPCPCANTGLSGRGCDNSDATGGAKLSALGTLSPDALVFSASGVVANVLSVFLQGNLDTGTPLPFGDGLRCAGGALKRLYIKNATGSAVSAPVAGEPSVSAQSASLGDPIAPGSTRWYQVYYRDPNLGFCPAPAGDSWNVTNGVAIDW
jgi:hypothetical protein